MFRKSSNNAYVPGTLNRAYDLIQGGGTETVGLRYGGLLGQTIVCNNGDALKLSNTAIGTLFEGIYQYVKFTTAVTRGELLFWDTNTNNGIPEFEVTHTPTATTNFRAGVCLLTDASATGRFGWIQVAGMASILFGASPAAADGQLVIQATAADTPLLTVATVNTFADGTAVPTTVAWHKSRVGVNYGVPTASVTNKVLMDLNAFVPNIG